MADLVLIKQIDGGLRRWYEYCGKGDEYNAENEDGEITGLIDAKCEES